LNGAFWTNNQLDPDSPMDSKPNNDHTKPEQNQKKPESNDPPKKRGRSKQWQNLTSSYLPLDPLYGVDQTEQDKVRDYSEGNLGKGLLYPDTFASSRLLLMPSASCALLVLFCRNRQSEYLIQLSLSPFTFFSFACTDLFRSSFFDNTTWKKKINLSAVQTTEWPKESCS
jgi:hypothetical protein